jgi:VWFA-related protein
MTSRRATLTWQTWAYLLFGILAVTSSSSVYAQEDASAFPANLSEVIEVHLVNVEVWVTDLKGNSIHGLSEADFELLEDGRPMEITHLTEFRGRQLAASDPPSEPPGIQSGSVPSTTESAPVHLVIYFDQLHMGSTSVRRIAKDLRRFVADGQIQASRIAILRQGYDLDLDAGFDSTLDQLLSILDQVAKSNTPTGGSFESRLAMSRMQQLWETSKNVPSPCRSMANLAQAEIAARVAELRHHFGVTLDNLHATTRFLAGLPGLKMLVLVTDSLELDPGRDLLRFARNVCPNERELDELSLLGDGAALRRGLVDFSLSANANRVTFYPMQASGLTTSSIYGAENRGLDTVATRGVDSLMRQVQQDGLLSLARETGGVATINRNSFKQPLESLARDMQSYYSLAYTPDQSGTGETRSIEVRVEIPHARVRHRPGYRDKTAKEIRDEQLDGAIAFGIMDNPLNLRLAVGNLEPQANGTQRIPLHLLAPADGLAFLPNPQPEARLEVVVRASEPATGEVLELTELLTTGPPAGESGLCDLTLDLSLPPGVYVLGVAARDLATNVTSFVSTTIAIGSMEDPQPTS